MQMVDLDWFIFFLVMEELKSEFDIFSLDLFRRLTQDNSVVMN